MDREKAEEIFVAGWMAAAAAYGGPSSDDEEEDAKEAFQEREDRFPGLT